MTEEKTSEQTGESPEEARRRKLEKITSLGHDPWGHRFDDRALIGDIRARQGEVKYVLEDGTEVDLPSEEELKTVSLKEWAGEKGKGKLNGPQVRAAGRIVLHRDKGKLQFIDIEDWTGKIQLFVGQKQVGEENWELIQCLDRRYAAADADRRTIDLCRQDSFPHKDTRPTAGQTRRLD